MGGDFGLKVVQIFRLAAVVDKDDVPEAILQKPLDDRVQLFIGIQRGQNHRDFGYIFHMR